MTLSAALLALADQRLPSGGHVHSGGLEQAITEGLVHDVRSLETLLLRRLRTTGLVTAGIAAATTSLIRDDASPLPPSVTSRTRLAGDVSQAIQWLDAEADARTPSPAQRAASRAQGRGLLRTARACWAAPSADLAWSRLGPRPHHPIVLGCAAAAAGLTAADASLATAYLAVSAPATAAQRLLALDPVAVAAVTVRLGDDIELIAHSATAATAATAHDDLALVAGFPRSRFSDLPDDSDPLLDLLAERHAARTERLFAS